MRVGRNVQELQAMTHALADVVGVEIEFERIPSYEDMMKNGYFSHTSPTYGSPFEMMKTFGITYKSAGENIAKGQKTPAAVMNGWMNSSGHRANILNASYEQIGVGFCKDSSGVTYWVQMFIR